MFRRTAFVSLGVCSLFSSPIVAHAGVCSGILHANHNIGLFDFQTESAVSNTDGGRYAYYVCIKNLMNSPLRSYWYVPGSMRWTPPNEETEDVRYYEDKQDNIFSGCLEYGNVGETTFAQFYGIGDDEQKIDSERQRGCANARPYSAEYNGNSKKSEKKPEQLKREIKIFIPSDQRDPANTMMVMRGIVGLFDDGDNRFRTVLDYYFEPYGDAKDGDPSKLRLIPEGISVDGPLALAFSKISKGGVELRSKGTIEISYPVGNSPTIDNILYFISDNQDGPNISFSVPVYVSSEK